MYDTLFIMPRLDGVSMTSTVWWIFVKPKPATQALWFFKRPIVLLVNVTLILFSFAIVY